MSKFKLLSIGFLHSSAWVFPPLGDLAFCYHKFDCELWMQIGLNMIAGNPVLPGNLWLLVA